MARVRKEARQQAARGSLAGLLAIAAGLELKGARGETWPPASLRFSPLPSLAAFYSKHIIMGV